MQVPPVRISGTIEACSEPLQTYKMEFSVNRFKILEYLQKTETLKMTFFIDQSFGIGLSKGKICFLLI